MDVFRLSFSPISQDPALSLQVPARSHRDLAYSLQDPPRSRWDLVEIQPDLFEIHRDLFEICPDFGRSVQSQPNLVVSNKILHSFKIFNSNQGPTGIQGGPTTPTDSIHRSATSPEKREPKLSGRFQDEHKLDPNWPVDRPTNHNQPYGE